MADSKTRSGATHLREEIVSYLDPIHAPHDNALKVAFDAPASEGMPEIQVGPAEGKLLYLLLRLAGAKKVVEVGTLAAYSAIWMARALPEDGHLWTVEASPKHAAVARENLRTAGLQDKASVIEGEAMVILPQLEPYGPFDAVFIDADKGNYDSYGWWAERNLKTGGLLMADNAFFFGRLMEQGPEAEAVRRMHQEAARSFDSVCIATGDGMLLGVKKSA